MANEFEVLSTVGYGRAKMTLWRCRQCGDRVRAKGKPRNYLCMEQNDPTPNNFDRGPRTPLSPASGSDNNFSVPPPAHQRAPVVGYPFSPTHNTLSQFNIHNVSQCLSLLHKSEFPQAHSISKLSVGALALGPRATISGATAPD